MFGFAFAVNRLRKLTLPFLISAAMILPTTGVDAARKQTSPYLVVRTATKAPMGFNGVCQRYDWACAADRQSGVANRAILRLAARINSRINRRVRSISDRRQYNQPEVWALPTRRGGDCEDFALLKKRELIAAGVSPNMLLMATVLDRRRNSHAVLVLRTDEGDFVLDNLTNQIHHWQDTGYTFLKLQNPSRPANWDAIFAGGIFG